MDALDSPRITSFEHNRTVFNNIRNMGKKTDNETVLSLLATV